MFVPHFCYGRFVDKYKTVLPSLLFNEFPKERENNGNVVVVVKGKIYFKMRRWSRRGENNKIVKECMKKLKRET